MKTSVQMRARQALHNDTSSGASAAAMRPPAYGIEFVDRGPPERLGTGIESPPGPVLQAVWKESATPPAVQEWDSLIDGVRWYANEKGELWYVVEQEGAADYSRWQGEANKETWEKWRRLRWAAHPDEYPELTAEEEIPTVLYKGVSRMRLSKDLKEPSLPTGIREGSATAVAMAKSGRPKTKLDEITLWFGLQGTSEKYCKDHSSSVLLRIDVDGHPVLKLGNDYFSTVPVAWSRVSYLNAKGGWSPLGDKVPANAKDLSEDSDDEDEGSWSE